MRQPESVRRHRVVWWLDVALFVAYLLLLSPRLTGLPVHEWLGLAFAAPVLLHLLFSWTWIATAMRRALKPARRRDAANLALNATLFVTTAVVVVSGVVVSRVALPWLGVATIDDRVWRTEHNRWTTWMWLSVSAHIAMNWRWIVTAARRRLRGTEAAE